MLQRLVSAVSGGANMSNLIFLGIATVAAVMFIYNLQLYLNIRKTIHQEQKQTKLLQVRRRSASRFRLLTPQRHKC